MEYVIDTVLSKSKRSAPLTKGFVDNKLILIVVDSLSKYIECEIVRSTSAEDRHNRCLALSFLSKWSALSVGK